MHCQTKRSRSVCSMACLKWLPWSCVCAAHSYANAHNAAQIAQTHTYATIHATLTAGMTSAYTRGTTEIFFAHIHTLRSERAASNYLQDICCERLFHQFAFSPLSCSVHCSCCSTARSKYVVIVQYAIAAVKRAPSSLIANRFMF